MMSLNTNFATAILFIVCLHTSAPVLNDLQKILHSDSTACI